MKAAIFAYSRQGCRTAEKILSGLAGEEVLAYTLERIAEAPFSPMEKPSREFYGRLFREMDALIFVGACGIAVREIAPHVKDKKLDPAVLVVDELGKFVIPLLSGHIGGANRLARIVSEQTGAQCVITTATDINGKFSVDDWAVKNGFSLSSMPLAKAVSAAILEHPLPLCSDFPVSGPYPGGIVPGDSGELGILLSYEIRCPFEKTLRLVPKNLHLGIGCRKGIAREAVEEAVDAVLESCRIDPKSIRCAASIDLKKEEAGLLEFCRSRNLPITFYSARTLSALEGDFTPSKFVASVTGVDNVCERAALLGADRLIVKKTVRSGVTVALAAENVEVQFG